MGIGAFGVDVEVEEVVSNIPTIGAIYPRFDFVFAAARSVCRRVGVTVLLVTWTATYRAVRDIFGAEVGFHSNRNEAIVNNTKRILRRVAT